MFAYSQAPETNLPFDSLWIWEEASVYFEFGESQLSTESTSILADLQKQFAHRPEVNYLIQAHTDAIGSDAANIRLSVDRAQEVAAWLRAQGIDSTHIRIESFGESRPQASNDTETGRQYNRRASIRVQELRSMFWMEGKVVDLGTGVGLPAEVLIRSREKLDSTTTNDMGVFRIPVPNNTVIGIEAYAPGYFFGNEMLKTDHRKPLDFQIKLPRVKVGEVIPLHHFYFVGDQDILLPRSEPELYRLLRFMQINPDLPIEIAGHINLPDQEPVGLSTWNYLLSVRRAKRIYNYLVAQGIHPDRLSYIGFGNWNMRFPNASTEQQQEMNRRVEIRVPVKGEILSSQDTLMPDADFLKRRLQEWKD